MALVSICLPNLNTVRYIPHRVQSIRAQIFHDYEVVVSDNYSIDGAYELLKDYADADPRVTLFQSQRAGLYANWNSCIRHSQSKWIYIATSDDIMSPDCLHELVREGEMRDCDVVCSPEWIIDGDGNEVSLTHPFLRNRVARRPKVGGWIDSKRQITCALLYSTPFLSITQLLIKRSAFEAIGMFETSYGSSADFLWQMMALRRLSWYYVPLKLGAWRLHESQATALEQTTKDEQRVRMLLALHSEGVFQDSFIDGASIGYALGSRGAAVPGTFPLAAKCAASVLLKHPRLAAKLLRGALALVAAL